MIKVLFILIFVLVTSNVSATNNVTKIINQAQFDLAMEKINNGKEVHLLLLPGRYVLKHTVRATAPLSIKGRKAIITCCRESFVPSNCVRVTGSHYVFKLSTPLSSFPLFYDKHGDILKISESVIDSVGVNYVEGDIIAPSSYDAGTELKIPISRNLERLKNKQYSCAYGYLDSGWGVVNFKLNYSDDIFFYCTTLTNCLTKDYQYDKTFYNKRVRYVLYNAEIKSDCIYYDSENIYVPKGEKEVFCVNRQDTEHQVPLLIANSDFHLESVEFVGIGRVHVESPENRTCEIRNCTFKDGLDYAIIINKKNGRGDDNSVVLNNCHFKNCSLLTGNIVRVTSTFRKNNCITIRNCTFERYPDSKVGYKNPTGAIYADGDITIENNVVKNTSRDHIYLSRGKIVVRGNFLYNTDDFNKSIDRNLSSDWGLIYCGAFATNTSEALNNDCHCILIENNLLYGAMGYVKDSRGIFMDSGRGDVTCRNNIILNTDCYSIDSRIVKYRGDASSVRNRYEGNIVSSNYRLAAGVAVDGENIPVIKKNFLTHRKDNTLSNIRIDEVDVIENVDESATISKGKLVVSKVLYKRLKKSSAWREIRKNIRKR